MIIVKLSWPDKALFPNRRHGRHWGASQSAKEAARMEGYWQTKNAIGRRKIDLKGFVPVLIIFHQPNRIRRDLDGMLGACKNSLDGIAKALGIDDSMFRPVSIDTTIDPLKAGFVEVRIGYGT